MDREKLVFAALKPADLALGAVVGALKATGTLPKATDSFYNFASGFMRNMYEKQNQLKAEGLDNVPQQGGVVFASNHQSWNDVQVIGATAPRRVRFLAKSEFEHWPVLRHMIALTDSPFVRRGGGKASGLDEAIDFLRDGKALVIFPEGTIPGEEDVMRYERDRETGLLRGHTGVVRLAIGAKVPVVPIGVSGTGASFPPEIYPRLELIHAPKNNPVTVRYGEPITFEELYDKEYSREDLRKATRKVMLAISQLVDHDKNFIPIQVPMKPLSLYSKVGVLLIHGFSSSVKTVSGMIPLLEERGIPYRMPVLRGHGTVYTDMEGTTAQDWYDDAEAALKDLYQEVDKVMVVGLSMGGLVAINLGIRHPDKIAGVITLAASLRFRDPLVPFTPILARLVKSWPSPESFNDATCRQSNENYSRFATDAFLSLLHYGADMEKRLGQLEVPICVIQSKRDQIIQPVSANIIYRDVSSCYREIHWFQKSGHELGQDLEKDEVFAKAMAFIDKFRKHDDE